MAPARRVRSPLVIDGEVITISAIYLPTHDAQESPMRIASLLLVLLACCGTTTAADSLTLTGEDDAKGGKRLGSWMAANDFEAETLESGSVKVKGKVLTMVISPNLTKDSLDRLLVTAFLTVTDEAKEDDEALNAMVMALNAESNIGCFSLDNDKDLVLQSQITFIDVIEKDELEKFLNWFDTTAFVYLTKHKRASAMLK